MGTWVNWGVKRMRRRRRAVTEGTKASNQVRRGPAVNLRLPWRLPGWWQRQSGAPGEKCRPGQGQVCLRLEKGLFNMEP